MSKSQTFTVGAEGADFATLAQAIAAADKGATLQVQPGRYAEDITLLQQVTVLGGGPAEEVVIAGSVQVSSGLSVVEGVTLAGTTRLSVGRCKLTRCTVTDTLVIDGGTPVVEQCTVSGGEVCFTSGSTAWVNAMGVFRFTCTIC